MFNFLKDNRIAGVALCFLALTACKEEEKKDKNIFNLKFEESYRRLSEQNLDGLMSKRLCGILIHFKSMQISNQRILWDVVSSNRSVLSFSATLTPIDKDKTKVTVEIPRDASGLEVYSGSQFYPRPALSQPIRPAIEEQIAAILEGRPYDVNRVTPGQDKICAIQNSGLKSGTVFTVN